MEKDCKYLQSSRLDRGAGYHQPAFPARPVTPDSMAVEVMTDLQRVPAATIEAELAIDFANQAMIARGVRSLLVIDGRGDVIGVVTSRDILGERPMQVVSKRGVRHDDIKVGDVMTPRGDIEVLDMAEVVRARVGSIIRTLQRSGRQHALVVDRDLVTNRQMVRGIFSASQIARQFDVSLETTEIARTFAEIEAAIADDVPA